jgi:hypothetical protein
LDLKKTSDDCVHSGNLIEKRGKTAAWCHGCQTMVGHYVADEAPSTFSQIVAPLKTQIPAARVVELTKPVDDGLGEAEIYVDLIHGRSGVRTPA